MKVSRFGQQASGLFPETRSPLPLGGSSFREPLQQGYGLSWRPSAFRDGHLQLLISYGGDHVAVFVVAEHLYARPVQPVEGLGGGMAVGVVHAALDHGHPWRKAAEKERGRRGIRSMVGDLQNGQRPR